MNVNYFEMFGFSYNAPCLLLALLLLLAIRCIMLAHLLVVDLMLMICVI